MSPNSPNRLVFCITRPSPVSEFKGGRTYTDTTRTEIEHSHHSHGWTLKYSLPSFVIGVSPQIAETADTPDTCKIVFEKTYALQKQPDQQVCDSTRRGVLLCFHKKQITSIIGWNVHVFWLLLINTARLLMQAPQNPHTQKGAEGYMSFTLFLTHDLSGVEL